MKGTITYFNKDKGYGFIHCSDFEKDLFFHVKDLFRTNLEDVDKGREVTFQSTKKDEKGISAKGVEII